MVKRFFTSIIHPLKSFYLARDIHIIRNSKLFDTDYYISQYREVRLSACDPIRHYCLTGWKEGRNPSALFDTNEYLKNNPDVASVDINPFVHYIKFGIYEDRHPVSENNNQSLESESIFSVASFNLCHRAELMLQARDGIRRILVIDFAVPTPDMDSGSARMFGILRILTGLKFSVTFAADQSENDAKYIDPLINLKITVLQGYSEIRTHLHEWGNGYSVVIISRPEVAERYLSVVRTYAAQAELDYDTVDLHYLRLRRGAELSKDPDLFTIAERYRQLEMLCCTSADRVFAITDTEKKVVLQNWPNIEVEVIPNIHAISVSTQPWLARDGLVFIGGYDHTPNVDAVVWFVHEVMPIITKHIPSIRFTILGSRPTETIQCLASNNVEVIGWVPDPEPYFSAARVFVAPLRYGAGMKGKVGQAMSLGLPVVTTSIGAEGMGLKQNVHALIADTPQAFATAVIRLHNDKELWEKLQRNSVTHIENNFSESAVASILREIWAGNVASHESAFGVTP
jgi:glycosyltransferase involved in cell wall biosynthesis